VIARYEYDGANRRVKKCFDADAPADPNGIDSYRHFYYNAAWQVVETRLSSSENTDPNTLDPEYQYVWSMRYIDAPILRDENKDGDGDCVDGDDERIYYITDANMNVTALTDVNNVLERYVYDAYGNATVLDADFSADADGVSDYANPIRWLLARPRDRPALRAEPLLPRPPRPVGPTRHARLRGRDKCLSICRIQPGAIPRLARLGQRSDI